MVITHILADGTEKTDITGHVVKKKDTEDLYEIFTQILKKRSQKANIKT